MIKLSCKTCGKSFNIKPYRVKTAKYCSISCYGLGDITGKRFGRLVALNLKFRKGKRGADYYWQFLCDCGKKKIIRRSNVIVGGTQSCGCIALDRNFAGLPALKHGMQGTRFYGIWSGILRRCNNPKQISYLVYGARGIKCLWPDFESFYADMYKSYLAHIKRFGQKQTSIDRIDVNGHYCKENCRWATYKEQGRNLRKNHLITWNGKTKPITQWADESGIKMHTIRARIYGLRWPLEKALTQKVR